MSADRAGGGRRVLCGSATLFLCLPRTVETGMGLLDKSIDTFGFFITVGSGATALYFAKPEYVSRSRSCEPLVACLFALHPCRLEPSYAAANPDVANEPHLPAGHKCTSFQS